MEFAGIGISKLDKRFEDVLGEGLNYISDAYVVYYETNKEYTHKEEDFEFNYKYVVKVSDYSQGDTDAEELQDQCEVELLLVVSPNSLDKEVYEELYSYNDGNLEYADIVDYGLGVEVGYKNFSINDIAKSDVLDTVANIINVVDVTRGFYLDKAWNSVGNTGWDIIERCIFNKRY